MVVSFLNQKGGVGKTTLSVNIAHIMSISGKNSRVLLVDADPQQSALSWSESRTAPPPFDVIGLAKKSLHRDLPSISAGYDFVVIDGPPRTTELARSCIMASDVVIVPCTPSPYDVWASEETVNLILEASVFNENIKCAFVINRKITNTAIGRDVSEALAAFNVPVLKNTICQRVIFAETASKGMTVFDIDKQKKSVSTTEISNVFDEILSIGRDQH